MTLVLSAIAKQFGGVAALQGFALTVNRGEVVALIGPNGSGKTTVLNCISGIVQPDDGAISWDGEDVTRFSVHARARRGVGRTFQELRVFGSLSALENVLLGLSADDETLRAAFRRGALRRTQAQRVDEARTALQGVGLDAARNRLAAELSYGQRRLLDLARVLVSSADLFLLDEPTAGAAPQLIPSILSAIEGLRRANRAVLFIEHNFDTLAVATRVVLLDAGRTILEGPPSQVRQDPVTVQVYFGGAA